MAKAKAPASEGRTKASAKPKAQQIKEPLVHPTLEIDWTTEPDPSFANVAVVLPSYETIGLVFAEVLPPVSTRTRADGSTYESANVVASIRLSPSAMPSFIDAAIEGWNRHLDAMAAHQKPVYPRFQRVPESIPGKSDK